VRKGTRDMEGQQVLWLGNWGKGCRGRAIPESGSRADIKHKVLIAQAASSQHARPVSLLLLLTPAALSPLAVMLLLAACRYPRDKVTWHGSVLCCMLREQC
jgi:hypothetical protein